MDITEIDLEALTVDELVELNQKLDVERQAVRDKMKAVNAVISAKLMSASIAAKLSPAELEAVKNASVSIAAPLSLKAEAKDPS